MNRRRLLLTSAALPFITTLSSCAPLSIDTTSAQAQLAGLEKALDGRLGVFAWDSTKNVVLAHRATERFPVNSTFKALLAGQALALDAHPPGLMNKYLAVSAGDIIKHAPVTEKFVGRNMTVAQLCQATVETSDNPAANILMRELGGPESLTSFMRSIGDNTFRLDRYEPELNTAIPGDLRDTSTPEAMVRSLHTLTLGGGLRPPQREQLRNWLLGTVTGSRRIQAGVPPGWRVAGKTGSGAYGAAHDLGLIWPPDRPPIVLAIYSHLNEPNAAWREEIIAAAARIVSAWVA
ncbi:class A beta-lactamase [Burkholderia ubonensis]|uniref:class A beta-lactamase n=1 Tax=Burkholderia ubonensis TaxID=101571 RepID=UPI000755CA76|nr:class A beta-lactamase [Burkholderia ubonensis]KWN81056.1 hypothetical protein WM23_20225 [Burkholderia ubonensis]